MSEAVTSVQKKINKGVKQLEQMIASSKKSLGKNPKMVDLKRHHALLMAYKGILNVGPSEKLRRLAAIKKVSGGRSFLGDVRMVSGGANPNANVGFLGTMPVVMPPPMITNPQTINTAGAQLLQQQAQQQPQQQQQQTAALPIVPPPGGRRRRRSQSPEGQSQQQRPRSGDGLKEQIDRMVAKSIHKQQTGLQPVGSPDLFDVVSKIVKELMTKERFLPKRGKGCGCSGGESRVAPPDPAPVKKAPMKKGGGARKPNAWIEFLREWKAKNPGVPHHEAMKRASPEYRKMKGN